MATKKKTLVSEHTTLILSRTEMTQLLAILKQAEGLVNIVEPQQTQNFLGGLIKKVKRASGTRIKSAP
jgi:hypothetical protein